MSIRALIPLGFLLLATACSHTPTKDEFDGKTAEMLYAEAYEDLKHHRFQRAAEVLDSLEARYPFGDHADKAQLALIYSYYKSDDFIASAAAADRFIQLHPRHKQVDYAHYMKALSHYEEALMGMNRYLPVERSQRDMTSSYQAFFAFDTLLSRYPASAYAPDAKQRMVYLKNMMADQMLYAARFYLAKGAPLAAANRAQEVIQYFDQTPALPEALSILVRAYKQLGLDDLAQDANLILQANYARSHWATILG